MENENIEVKKPNVKMIVISSVILFVGIILIWPSKKAKPKLPVIKPVIKKPAKTITKTITITPTEKTEETIEENEEEEELNELLNEELDHVDE